MDMKTNNNLRQKNIESYENKFTITQIASMFKMRGDHGIFYSPLIAKKRRGNLLKQESRHAKLLEQSHKDALQAWIDENCSITLQKLKNRLERQFSIVVSVATVSGAVSAFEYTYKAVTCFPIRKNDEQSLNDREAYARQFMNLLATYDQEKFLFIDEIEFNNSMRLRFGRSLRGTRSIHHVRNI
ncbi:hypothetical protein CDIK_4278 [Cucumispora dikerogammari]|nr:hypothetical protein CDIK_4278 [Cucumispora dikerogammari]